MKDYENLLTSASTAVAIHPKDDDVAIKVENKKDLLFDLVNLTEFFKVSKRTLFNWRKRENLPLFELGGKLFISRSKLLAFIADKERRTA